jgi:HAD superfamily hydrolase (TIGR01509 family)
VDSEPIANPILGQHLSALGLEMSFDEIMAEFVGLSMKTVVEKIERQWGRPLPGGWLENLQRDTFAAFERELEPVAGVRDILAGLKAEGQHFCVASSGSPEKIRFTLTLTELYPYFEGRIFSASEVARGKPAPDLFQRAADVNGARYNKTVVIEDSLPGVQAAISAGMTALGFAARGQGAELQKAGAHIFTRMSNLPALLKKTQN